jgi:hypothetical protein
MQEPPWSKEQEDEQEESEDEGEDDTHMKPSSEHPNWKWVMLR